MPKQARPAPRWQAPRQAKRRQGLPMPEASTVFTTMAKPKGLKPCPSKQDLHQGGKHQGKPRGDKDCQCQRQAQCSPPWLSPKGSSHAQASKTCTKLASTKASQEETRTANARGQAQCSPPCPGKGPKPCTSKPPCNKMPRTKASQDKAGISKPDHGHAVALRIPVQAGLLGQGSSSLLHCPWCAPALSRA